MRVLSDRSCQRERRGSQGGRKRAEAGDGTGTSLDSRAASGDLVFGRGSARARRVASVLARAVARSGRARADA
eukprot:29605-Pelagococcus_subviridis.AAC.3